MEEALFDCGAAAVSLHDGGDTPVLEPAPGAHPLWSETRVAGLFAPDTDLDAVCRALTEALGLREPPPHETGELEARDWREAWREHFGPRCFGHSLWVCPFDTPPPQAEARIVWIEPGLAFGTGSHETTALCLQALAAAPPRGQRVLDYGCGSGILALAALALGARRVTATDIDPQALLATRENARRNGTLARLALATPGRLAALEYDLVLANILADTLIGLRETLAALGAAGSRLLLSGILARQAPEVMRAFDGDFDFEPMRVAGEWALLDGRRRR